MVRGFNMKSKSIYLIKELLIDPEENSRFRAIRYENIGFVYNMREAVMLVEKSGNEIGTGWPIDEGKALPNIKYEKIDYINL